MQSATYSYPNRWYLQLSLALARSIIIYSSTLYRFAELLLSEL